MSIYETNPLLKGHTHIRLLKILPVSASSQDRITCSFELFDLNAAPRYQALSYEWGPKTPVKEIEVINQPTTIRQNLWNFLSRLRAHCYYGFLWCDAICIDQANDNERNHQVQLMSQIYRNAHSVLAWLGEEDRDSSTTLSQIRSMSVVEKSFGELRLRETIWRGLVALSERTYWTRIWIVQEITVAEVIQLFCGAEVIRWPDFAMACTFITANEPIGDSQIWAKWLWDPTAWERKRLGDAERMIHSTIQALSESTMYGLFRSHDRWPRYKKSFQTLSNRYSTSGCEDPRDRIFALLIISREVVVDHPFTVDYSKSMEETFFALAEWAAAGPVKTDRRLEFAVLVADVLNMHWGEYLLETKIDADSQRSPIFFQWIEKLCE